ncbi:sensory box histidine kinase [Acidisarcina polymorpha]|uniref:histidine kinase n=1 Tax=Acidisarcina polymorpha TaxID=2211140 RepID=A0A2Z5FVL6_9BACT|nr:ATP-binding protein [Acidisarcina polymorpha]AXC10456.1 sensory box histidine kinase [Acidisarcina polymorpha]
MEQLITDRNVSAVENAAPLPQVICALKKVTQLNGLTDPEYEWLARYGEQRFEPAGAVLFHEGDPAERMTILLKGEIHVRRERGAADALFIGRSGQITGLLPFSRMKFYGGMGYTTADSWALDYDRSLFPEMLTAIPSMGQRCVGILLDRVREVTRMEQQTEKLTALGKLAANLAHELNNPASAAQRAAGGLLDELRIYGHEKYKLGSLCMDDSKLQQVRNWQDSISAIARERQQTGGVDVSLQEDGIYSWLAAHGVENAWQIAPELAEAGICADHLAPLADLLDARATTVVLSQFSSSLRAERMTEAMIDSTARIFDLIKAIKDYSYMDQAPIQEIDVPRALDTTLSMMQLRLQHVEVVRTYAPDLPCINAYGSELNQVWTALIENALDAIQDNGRIELKALASGDLLLVEVWDNGPGIPAEDQDRIFEPFFTTKPPGKGLGLGLDVVMRIVRKHRGFVRVQSAPGATCFQVRLPLQQLQAY